jgi:hypothetical protein
MACVLSISAASALPEDVEKGRGPVSPANAATHRSGLPDRVSRGESAGCRRQRQKALSSPASALPWS